MQKVARRLVGGIVAAVIASGLTGCAKEIAKEQLTAGILPPIVNPITEVNQSLRDLPPPSQKVVVAVYNYADQTGQFKPSEATQSLSRAVTQGATSVLIKALQDVGNGSWFTVVEREKIDNLLKERRIITQMRMTYLGEKQINPQALPPLLFAGIIFEGGIIGFDSNLQTGGLGARLLGIGGDLKYRLDTITIYLRAVSTKTGQVVASVTTHKTIASVALQGGIFKYIALDKILEAEAGFTKNEPDQLAVQQAIEKAVYSMVIEGSDSNVWSFADKTAQSKLFETYKEQETASANTSSKAKLADATPPATSNTDPVRTAAVPSNATNATGAVANQPKTSSKQQTMPAAPPNASVGGDGKRDSGWSTAIAPASPWQASTAPIGETGTGPAGTDEKSGRRVSSR
jgi:curli production assembly/transport component CsgG